MIKQLTLALFLSFTAGFTLHAAPEPKTQVLPGDVHTYVWELEGHNYWDGIELRLVIPVGLVHEQEGEAGATQALYQLVQSGSPHFSKEEIDYFFSQINRYVSWSSEQGHLDTTTFQINIPYRRQDLLPQAFDLFADWAWGWSPIEGELRVSEDEGVSEDAIARASYAGRSTSYWPEKPSHPSTLCDFYNRTYRSLPIAVVAVGDFDGEWVEEMIARSFANPPSGNLGPLLEATPSEKWPKQVAFATSSDPYEAELTATIALPITATLPMSARQIVLSRFLQAYLEDKLQEIFPKSDVAETYIGEFVAVTRSCVMQEFSWECTPELTVPPLRILDAELKQIAQEGLARGDLEIIRARLGQEDQWDCDSNDLADNCADHFCGYHSLMTEDHIAALKRAVASITSEEIRAYVASFPPLSTGRIFVEVGYSTREKALRYKPQLEEFFRQ